AWATQKSFKTGALHASLFLTERGEPRNLTGDYARVVLIQVLAVPHVERVVLRPSIGITAHPVERQRRKLIRARGIDVHLFAKTINVQKKCPGPPFRQRRQR